MDIRYLAGLFDGEGSVSVYWSQKNRKVLWLKVTITLTKGNELLKEIQEKFGGGISLYKRKKGHTQAYRWEISGYPAISFLTHIQGKCRIKRKVIDLALTWKDLKRGFCRQKPITKREIQRRTRLFKGIKALNKRGEMEEV